MKVSPAPLNRGGAARALTTTRHAQAINARSIKKVAEAKARKKRRTERALTKIRKKSLALSEKADLSEREKASEMSRLSRKKLTQAECAIGTFHAEHYLPALEKLAYHRPHCQILGKDHCAGARRAAFRHRPSVRTRRD